MFSVFMTPSSLHFFSFPSIAISDKHACHSSFSPSPPFFISLSLLPPTTLLSSRTFFVFIDFLSPFRIRIGSKPQLHGCQIRSFRFYYAKVLHPSIQVVALKATLK